MMDRIEELLKEQFEYEPQVTSTDPNERKLARRMRIQRRAEAIRRKQLPEDEKARIKAKLTLYQEQSDKSDQIIAKLIQQASELVTNVRVATDSREADRRELEGIGREKIIQQIEEEGSKAKTIFDEINDQWQDILKYDDPLAINDAIANQKEKCNELIKQKDGIILMLRNELINSDLKFERDQMRQNIDISALSKRIEKQVTMMRSAYNQELSLIEEALLVEKKVLIELSKKRWKHFFTKRIKQEIANDERKFAQVDAFEALIHQHHLKFQERFRDTKIKLSKEVERMQMEYERIKIDILINTEKIDYNYQILKRREDENVLIKSQQKRRLNKMQDAINTEKDEMKEYTTKTDEQFATLTHQIIKLQHYVLDTDEKSNLIAKQNDERFNELWEYNHEKVVKLVKKILMTDKIIYEQQLAMKWRTTEKDIKKKEQLPSYQNAMVYLENEKKKSKITRTKKKKPLRFGGRKHVNICPDDNVETNAYRRLLKQIFTRIGTSSSFLLDPVIKTMFTTQTQDEKTMVTIERVFEILRVKNPKQIEILVQYFLPYAVCPVCMKRKRKARSRNSKGASTSKHRDRKRGSSSSSDEEIPLLPAPFNEKLFGKMINKFQGENKSLEDIINNVTISRHISHTDSGSSSESEGEMKGPKVGGAMGLGLVHLSRSKVEGAKPCRPSCVKNHPLMISPVFVLRAIRDFSSDLLPHQLKFIPKQPKTISFRIHNVKRNLSRLLTEDDIKFFWNQYKKIFPSTKNFIWNGVLFGLKKYREILKDRKIISEEVLCLRNRNDELRHSLSIYNPSNVNLKPPCPLKRPNVA